MTTKDELREAVARGIPITARYKPEENGLRKQLRKAVIAAVEPIVKRLEDHIAELEDGRALAIAREALTVALDRIAELEADQISEQQVEDS